MYQNAQAIQDKYEYAFYGFSIQPFEHRVVCVCLERHGPNNPDDPSYRFLRILNTGSVSSRKHGMEVWYLQLKYFKLVNCISFSFDLIISINFFFHI